MMMMQNFLNRKNSTGAPCPPCPKNP